jgi:hypothetical protein
MLKTSLRIVARTFGSQPRAAHLSRRTWAAIAKLSPMMCCCPGQTGFQTYWPEPNPYFLRKQGGIGIGRLRSGAHARSLATVYGSIKPLLVLTSAFTIPYSVFLKVPSAVPPAAGPVALPVALTVVVWVVLPVAVPIALGVAIPVALPVAVRVAVPVALSIALPVALPVALTIAV